MSTMYAFRNDQAIEIFRLRHTLREAAENGRWSPRVEQALARLLELGQGGRGELLFEHRRWSIQFEHYRAA